MDDPCTLARAAYTGLSQAAVAELSLGRADARFRLVAGATLLRDDTDDPALAATGAGGKLAFHAGLGRTTDLVLTGAATARRFDAASRGREDLQLRGEAYFIVSLSPSLALVAGASALENDSTDPMYAHAKLLGFVALSLGYSRP